MPIFYDSIIIGGGHNGLVCAAYLAKAGQKVLVLEKRHVLGGAAVSEELHPGFTFSVCSYVVSLFRPHIIRDLELPKYGFDLIPLECSYSPLLEGDSLCRWADSHRSRREIARFSQHDAEIYPEFSLAMSRLAMFARHIIDTPAPDPASLNPRDLLAMSRLAKLARQNFRAYPEFLQLQLQLLTMSAVDFLELWFESDQLISPMSCSGIIGTYLGVRSPGTAYVLLHHYMGEIDGAFRSWGFSRGGTGAVSMSIARAAEAHGAEIMTEAGVSEIIVETGRAVGVALENGDEHRAKRVISALDPNRTFLKLIDEDALPGDFIESIKRYKLRGSSGKVNFAVDSVPQFRDDRFSREGTRHLRGDVAIGPSIDYLERAYDEAKYGQYSSRPYINMVIPSLVDPSVAPPGKHIVSCFVQYAPYHLSTGADTWPEHRDGFRDAVIDTVEHFAPGFKDSILYTQTLTPWDLEKTFGLTEGNIFHGELSAEQLMHARPTPGHNFHRYQTPIDNLHMCASGVHPGGGVMGAPGYLAAMELLKKSS